MSTYKILTPPRQNIAKFFNCWYDTNMKLELFLKQRVKELNEIHEIEGGAFSRLSKSYIKILLLIFNLPFKNKKRRIFTISLLVYFIVLIISVGTFFTNVDFSVLSVIEAILKMIFAYLVAVGGLSLLILVIMMIGGGLRRKAIKEYKRKHGGYIQFSNSQYQKAAEVLENFKQIKYKEAVKKYTQEIVDLLIITDSIFMARYHVAPFYYKHFLERAVSIKSIKENREAYDDEE